ncbi:mdm2-binding protein-like isoform X2 [Acropora millepora]|uniref:mdm2-binding protein-like isoform X2 n=1 Tax=Acropora millepora TaxID=45264 RepID=UPI001CF2D64E|nr:mdm2-binding protein-like isoform X2 [Acropora millepora]
MHGCRRGFKIGSFMERYFVFLVVHDEVSKQEGCKCNEEVIPTLKSLSKNIYEHCIKDKHAYGDLENSQYLGFDPVLGLKDVLPKICFSLVRDRILLEEVESYSEWCEGAHLEELSRKLEKQVANNQENIADGTSCDKDSEISEKLHNLADDLPHHAGAPLDIFWFICGENNISIRSHLNLFGALKRLQQWHNANITVLCGNGYDRSSFLKMWQVGLHLSLAQLSKKEAALEQFNSTVIWHGSLVFNKDQSKIVFPGFKLCNLRKNKKKMKQASDSSVVKDVDLCIGPEIIIFCRVDKSTVPLHLFVPVKLALSIPCSSIKQSARLVEWLSLENNEDVALLGSVRLTVPSEKISQERNTEAWFDFVQGESSDSQIDDEVNYDVRICLICGATDEKLNFFFLRSPDHLNGRLHQDLDFICSSFRISQDQEVGGPLKFPDLTDSFLETEQNINETLLCKLEQELGANWEETCEVSPPPDLMEQLDETKSKLLQEERKRLLQEGKEIELEAVKRETLLFRKPEPMSPSKWPERIWLMKNDPNSKINKVADKTKFTSDVSSISVQDILDKFRSDGMPVTNELCPVPTLNDRLIDKHIHVNKSKSVEDIKGENYPEALSALYHGIEYCLDDRKSLAKDSQVSALQSANVKLETFSSYVSRDKQAERLQPRPFKKAKITDQKHNLMRLRVPLNKIKAMGTNVNLAPVRRAPLVKRKSPLVKKPPVAMKRKREESTEEEAKQDRVKEGTKKETRSERHKRRLRQVVQKTLEDNGIDSKHKSYQACADRLYSLCKSFLKDLRSSHGLNDEMKRLAKSNVQQVIEFETKRKSGSENT